jgi:phospholipid-binding lipoprotein MlaA
MQASNLPRDDIIMRLLLQRLLVVVFLLESACSAALHAGPADKGPGAAAVADTEPADPGSNDPVEATNRKIFGANMAIDHAVSKPVVTAYKDDVPADLRHGVHNFVTNLGEPKVLVNDLLQGNMLRALNTTGRFVLNSTVGVAGLFDAAATLGMPHHDADFGQTFGVWGIATGPSVQLPALGSSNVRDSIGMVLGLVFNPLSAIPGGAMVGITTAGAGGAMVDGRADVLDASDALQKGSLDYYATSRSVSAQRRDAMVEDGRAGRIDGMPQPAPP